MSALGSRRQLILMHFVRDVNRITQSTWVKTAPAIVGRHMERLVFLQVPRVSVLAAPTKFPWSGSSALLENTSCILRFVSCVAYISFILIDTGNIDIGNLE